MSVSNVKNPDPNYAGQQSTDGPWRNPISSGSSGSTSSTSPQTRKDADIPFDQKKIRKQNDPNGRVGKSYDGPGPDGDNRPSHTTNKNAANSKSNVSPFELNNKKGDDPGRIILAPSTFSYLHQPFGMKRDWSKAAKGDSGSTGSAPSATSKQDRVIKAPPTDPDQKRNSSPTLPLVLQNKTGGSTGSGDDGKTTDSGPNPNQKAADPAAWSALTNDPATEAQLNTPLADAQTLLANWTKWGITPSTDFANPPASMPPDGQALLKSIAANPTLYRAMFSIRTTQTSQIIGNLQAFSDQATKDLTTAVNSFNAYRAKNPNADPQALEVTRQAAIVMANLTLISAAPTPTNATPPASGNPLNASLGFVAQNPVTFGSELSQAVGLWSSPGMAGILDMAGDNPTTAEPDGVFSGQNMQNWMAAAAPATNDDYMSLMDTAANGAAVAGVDTSGLGPDVLVHPSLYTGQQKAAVLGQLQIAYTKLLGAEQQGFAASNLGANEAGYKTTLAADIAQLSQDPDVATYLSTAGAAQLQNMVQGDPALNTQAQDTLAGIKDGSAIHAAATSANMPAALDALTRQASFVQRALGTNGQNLPLDLSTYGTPADQAAIAKFFNDAVMNGSDLSLALSNGVDPSKAMADFTKEIADFMPFKPWTQLGLTADQAMAKMQTSTSDTMMDSLLRSSDFKGDMKTAFGDAAGNLDVTKLTATITSLEAADPGNFTDSSGALVPATSIVAGVKALWDTVVNGAFAPYDIATLTFPEFRNQTLEKYLGAGVFHAVGALLGGAVLGLKSAGPAQTPAQIASLVGAGVSVMGNVLSASSRYAASTINDANPSFLGLTKDQARHITIGGESLLALGGLLSGAFGIMSGIKSLADGDVADGAVGLAGSATSIVSASAYLGYFAGELGTFGEISETTLSAISLVGESFGAVSGFLGAAGMFAFSAVQQLKQSNLEDKFTDQFNSIVNQYGIKPS